MNEEAILELYNELSTDYEVGDIDQFKAYLQDPESRVDFFEQIIKPIYAVEDIADFEAFYGLKKKDDTAFGLEDGSSELTPLSRNQQLGVTPAVEKDTAIERIFGKNEVTDFFGDLYRSGVQGYAQGATVDDALNLFAKGQDISDEDLKEYIESVRKMESFGPSEEMQDFTKIYEKNGKGVWGFISGVAQNPTVIPQLFTSSVSAMLNKGSIAAGAAGAATGGIGAGLATGGLAAIPGALIGGIGGVSGALETGLSYTEFLKEELDKEGLSFDEDNVKKILLNEEAMNSIKNKALARGLTIAAIDAFSGGLATSVTRKTATKLGSKLAGATAGGTVEALGGATGEAAARLVTGQEMDIAEIGFEGVAGTATAPLTVGAGLMKPPSYSMNGGKASRKDIQTLLSTGTPEQIAAVKISVKNDSDLYKEAQTKKSDIILLAEIEAANPGIIEEDKSKLLVLEKARQTLANSNIKSAKNNLEIIDKQIDDISKKYLPIEQEVLTKEEKDAVQESSTEKVDVRQQPTDGEGVGVGNITEPTTEITPQEETVAPTDQEITEEADVTEVVKEKDGVTTTNFEKIIKGRKRSNSLAPISVLDNYELDLEANGIEGMDIVGVREIRKKDGVTNATILVREGNEQFEAEVVLQDKAKEGVDVTEVEEARPTGFITKPSIEKPFIVPTKNKKPSSTQINFTEDGKIESVVNKKTGKPVSTKTRKVAEKLYLESLIDVNDGKFTEYQEGVTEERANQFVAENSQNVREIAEAIESEKNSIVNQRLEFDEADVLYDIDGYFTIEDIAEVWDERLVNENSKSGRNIRRYWTRPALDKFGSPTLGISKIDTTAQELGISVEALKEIIIDYPTRNINRPEEFSRAVAKVGKTDALIDLENKFEKLTGLKATDTNINTVLDIDPNRPPLTEEQKLSLIEREQAIAESEGERVIKGKKVSAEQVVGGKPKEVTVEEIKALKDQIRLEARAAREAKGDQTARRKAISNAISALQAVGKINIAKAKSLINKISTVDLNKAIQVEKVLAYVEKVFTKADYDAKLSEAESLRKSIKKLSKTEKLDVYPVEAAKRFLEIDPVLVEDIESYIEEAKKVKDGVTPSTKTKTMPALDIKKTDEYTTSEVNKQKEIKLEAEKEVFQELTGLSPDELSLQDMREIVNGVEQDQPADVREKELESKAKANADVIKKGLNKTFNTVSTIVNQLIEAETDPFTGEIIELTKEQKKLVKDFLNIDINKLSDADAVIALDSLINFATNKTTGGMGAIVRRSEGQLNSQTFLNLGYKAIPLSVITDKIKIAGIISRGWNEYISSLPLMLETMFKGQSKAAAFERLSGLSELKRGASNGVTIAREIADRYSKAFFKKNRLGYLKTKANGEDFNTSFNNIERDMFARLKRTIPGEEQVEFKRIKGLIEQSIDVLKEASLDEKAKLYEEVYDKILKDSDNISEVESKVDKTNAEAVRWMINEWSKFYPKLNELNVNIYNKILNKEVDYTPVTFSSIEKTEKIGEIGEPILEFSLKKISDKKTGVLMEALRPTQLPKGRYLNLNFDSNNILALEKAVIDLKTAGAIQQLKGFFNSKNFLEIVPSSNDRKILTDRVIELVEAKRGRNYINNDSKQILKSLNSYSLFGVSRTLGSVSQAVKQTVPVYINTIINAGPEYTLKATNMVSTNPDINKLINNSGYSIASRGIESITNLESINSKIESAASGNAEATVRAVNKLQSMWLQGFLVKPDRAIARLSWWAYYLKSLEKQGIDTSRVDWSSHKIDSKAGDYAQQQVDRQQNVSDIDLQGKVFRSKNPSIQFARKALLPFSNFLMNQKTRMYSDLTIVTSKTATKEDKIAAWKSLGGLAAETVTFNLLGLYIIQGLVLLSAENDEDAEEKLKRFNNRKKGRAGQALKDIISPLPLGIIDEPLVKGINTLIRVADSDDPYQFFEAQPKDAWDNLGLYSIPLTRFDEWLEMTNMAINGNYEVTGPFGKKTTKKLNSSGKGDMLGNWLGYTAYSAGFLPAEAGTIARNNVKYIKKNKTKK